MRILVTGGGGFIGSSVVDALVRERHAVTVLDDFSTGRRQYIHPRAEILEGDILDPVMIDRVESAAFDVLCHHAAQIDVRFSVADPPRDAELNIIGSLKLFEAARRAGTRKIIFASSGGAIYGEPLVAPQSEEHPERPLSPYGCAKLAIDQYLYYYNMVHGISTVSLRYGNVYGPRQRRDGEAGVVAIFAGALLEGRPVTINGNGEQTRDYVFVEDVVKANLAALQPEIQGRFNVGTGQETSVNELYRLIAAAVGSDLVPTFGPSKKGEQMRSVLDGTRLRAMTGLPAPLDLREGLSRTVTWLREQN